MLTFKQYIKKSDGKIPTYIHFKEIPFEVELNEAANPNYTPKPYESEPELPHLHRWIEKCLQEHKDMHGDYNTDVIAQDLGWNHVLTNAHSSAIGAYTFDMSQPINKTLIEGHTDFSKNTSLHERATRVNDALSDAISKNKMPKAASVFSGIGFDPDKYVDENNRLHSPAFISTSLEPNTARGFSESRRPIDGNTTGRVTDWIGNRHILHISLKPGDRAISAQKHSTYPEENEVIIDKNTTLQRHSVEKYHSPAYGTFHVHRMSVVE